MSHELVNILFLGVAGLMTWWNLRIQAYPEAALTFMAFLCGLLRVSLQ